MKACACGCGGQIPEKDERGRPRSYVGGHHNKGKSNPWLARPNSKNVRTGRMWAQKKKAHDVLCELKRIGGCSQNPLLDVHHQDKDPTNNEPMNLMKVCRSHHLLLDRGKIDLANPVMPPFYVDGSGKRRYL